MSNQKKWIVGYHEHDSLLETRPEEDLTEEERKAAWEDYEQEKKGLIYGYAGFQQQLPTMGNTLQATNMPRNLPFTTYLRGPTIRPQVQGICLHKCVSNIYVTGIQCIVCYLPDYRIILKVLLVSLKWFWSCRLHWEGVIWAILIPHVLPPIIIMIHML